ncbi:MAG TPA: hypothetical protein IAB17_04550 [Candidatus Alectryocaccobium stercorigallinarum]|nr:hypothetical protein [Candidatus Alectryocaccobium stercorigallinarum]
MTSKISFFKLLKAEMKNQGWLIALASFLCAVLFPVNYQLQLDRIANSVYTDISPAEAAELISMDKQNATLDILGAGNDLTMILTVIAAAVCAAAFFSYLHSREKTDFYHSLAIRRETHFAVRYLGGLFTALIPYIACILIAFFGIGTAAGTVNAETTTAVLSAAGFFCLSFCAIYTLCVLAMLITGRLLIALGGMIFFCAYGPICVQLVQNMMNRFFDTYYVPYWHSDIGTYFSPVSLMTYIGKGLRYSESSPVSIWAALVAFIIGGLLLCVFVYKKRPSEAAENALIHTKLESIFKVAVCIPGAIALASVAEFFTGYDSDMWFIVSALLSAFLINGVIEFVYNFDLRNIIRHKISGGIAIGGTALALVLLIFDPLGYDRWQPDIDDVQSMSIYSYSMTEPLSEYYTSYGNEVFFLDRELKDFAPVYELVHETINDPETVSSESRTDTLNVCYTLKDGSKHYRYYTVSEAALKATLEELSLSDEFREKYYPSAWPEVKESDGVSVTDWKNFSIKQQVLDLSGSELDELKQLYADETNKVSFSDMEKSQPVACLTFLTESVSESQYWQNPGTEVSCFIYPQHEKTLQFLKAHGMTETPLDAAEIASLSLQIPEEPVHTSIIDPSEQSLSQEAAGYTSYSEYLFSSEADINQVLSCIERCRYYIDDEGCEPNYIYIVFKDGDVIDAYCAITDMDALAPLLNNN